jgi:hypothetical protein
MDKTGMRMPVGASKIIHLSYFHPIWLFFLIGARLPRSLGKKIQTRVGLVWKGLFNII